MGKIHIQKQGKGSLRIADETSQKIIIEPLIEYFC